LIELGAKKNLKNIYDVSNKSLIVKNKNNLNRDISILKDKNYEYSELKYE
jgi:hypothetical protein